MSDDRELNGRRALVGGGTQGIVAADVAAAEGCAIVADLNQLLDRTSLQLTRNAIQNHAAQPT